MGGWPALVAFLMLCFSTVLWADNSAPEPAAKEPGKKEATSEASKEKDDKEAIKGIKLKAQLIWGTDLEKPADTKEKKIKNLDPEFCKKLGRLFKWKNYYEVDKQKIVVPFNGSQITCMSHDCMVEVFHRGDNQFEVHLYGQNKLVQKICKDLTKGEYIMLGGNVKEKENEAWIVSLCLAE